MDGCPVQKNNVIFIKKIKILLLSPHCTYVSFTYSANFAVRCTFAKVAIMSLIILHHLTHCVIKQLHYNNDTLFIWNVDKKYTLFLRTFLHITFASFILKSAWIYYYVSCKIYICLIFTISRRIFLLVYNNHYLPIVLLIILYLR